MKPEANNIHEDNTYWQVPVKLICRGRRPCNRPGTTKLKRILETAKEEMKALNG